MTHTILAKIFNTKMLDNHSHQFIRDTNNIGILNTATNEITFLTHVELSILSFALLNFTQKVCNDYFGYHNIENKPFIIELNTNLLFYIYKGTVDSYSKQFTAGNVSEDNISFTSKPSWKIDLVEAKTTDMLLIGTVYETIHSYIPYSIPVLFEVLQQNITDYLTKGELSA